MNEIVPIDRPKCRMRHPLRNQWDGQREAFLALAGERTKQGVMARAMLDLVPPFLAVLERERDNATPAEHMLDAIAAVAGMLIENAVENKNVLMPPHAALDRMLRMIDAVVRPRVAGRRKQPRIIVPGRE